MFKKKFLVMLGAIILLSCFRCAGAWAAHARALNKSRISPLFLTAARNADLVEPDLLRSATIRLSGMVDKEGYIEYRAEPKEEEGYGAGQAPILPAPGTPQVIIPWDGGSAHQGNGTKRQNGHNVKDGTNVKKKDRTKEWDTLKGPTPQASPGKTPILPSPDVAPPDASK